jgi:ketosteroid isomerase-like protein
MKKIGMLVLLGLLAVTPPVGAQGGKPAPEDPAHEDLRRLRREMVEAINKNDLDALLGHLDKDVVVTWMNGEVSRKPSEVRAYIERLTKGENRFVQSYTTEVEADELTHLYGDTGVASGSSKDRFVLTDGREFVVNSRWTATLVKKGGKWLVASFHGSTNMFDNPVLYIAVRRAATWAGGIAAVLGIAVGFGVAWWLRRRKPGLQPAAPA